MYYLYKNTSSKSQLTGKYSDQDEAIAYMEHLAMNNADETATGYAIRDQEFKT